MTFVHIPSGDPPHRVADVPLMTHVGDQGQQSAFRHSDSRAQSRQPDGVPGNGQPLAFGGKMARRLGRVKQDERP